jgi:hypothetical protein
MMYELLMKNDFLKVEYGCPASNFTQEMAPWNKAFTKALNSLSEQWKQAIIKAVETGKKNGMVNAKTDGEQVAVFIMSGYWGIRNLGKLKNSKSVYQVYLKQLKNYLETLR